MQHIPVYEPLFIGNEKKYLQECIDSGWVSSDGPFVKKFEEEFAKWSGNKYALTVCNGTVAIELSMILALTKKPNAHMLIPNSTIFSCWLARERVYNGYKHDHYISSIGGMCGDIYQNYLNGRYEGFAVPSDIVLRCHLFGMFCNIGLKHNPINIDDLSQYWEPYTVGTVGCYSLYANKTITSGEGGVVVTNDKSLYEYGKHYRDLFHSNIRFVHNQVGYNMRMSNLQAAVALAQLEKIDRFIDIKRKHRELYQKYLSGIHNLDYYYVKTPWMHLIRVKGPYNAGKIVDKMQEKGISCRRYFYPITMQKPVLDIMGNTGKRGIQDWEQLLYLPSGLNLNERSIIYICKTLKNTLDSII